MSKVSFEGIGEMVATFACAKEVQAGQVVKMTADGTVGPCDAGDRPCGVALSDGEKGFAAVQIGGLVKAPVSEEGITPGWCKLSADGQGGLHADSGTGTDFLVVWVESDGAVVRL